MSTLENEFITTVLNSPEKLKRFLIDHGIEGKSICPIMFFDEEDKEKYLKN